MGAMNTFIINGLELFFALCIGHAIADFALQGVPMAKGKNRNLKLDWIPPGQGAVKVWPHWMSAHCAIHAGAVWLVTGSSILATIEFALHFFIDLAKCENWTNPHQDQALHILCKLAYVISQ